MNCPGPREWDNCYEYQCRCWMIAITSAYWNIIWLLVMLRCFLRKSSPASLMGFSGCSTASLTNHLLSSKKLPLSRAEILQEDLSRLKSKSWPLHLVMNCDINNTMLRCSKEWNHWSGLLLFLFTQWQSLNQLKHLLQCMAQGHLWFSFSSKKKPGCEELHWWSAS